jgi:hypothetical protein
MVDLIAPCARLASASDHSPYRDLYVSSLAGQKGPQALVMNLYSTTTERRIRKRI